MAPLNFIIPSNFSLTIGGIDFTKCVADLSIQRPLPEPKTPQTWTGSITLTTPINPAYIPESLDPAINPNGRWEIGCYQILLQFGTTRLCPPLYVMGYRYNDQTRTAEIEVGDDLTLRSDAKPGFDYQRLGFSAPSGATVAGLVERACLSVGLTNYSVTGLAATIPVAPDKNEGSWIEWAQSYAGERGYWLYMHTDGQVRLRNYPFSNTPVLLTRSRSQVDSWDPIFVDIPKDRYVCSGTGERLVPTDSPGPQSNVRERSDDVLFYAGSPPQDRISTGVVERVTETIEANGIFEYKYRKRVITERALGYIDGDSYPGSFVMITASDYLEEHTFDFYTGALKSITITQQIPLPLISTEMDNLVDEIVKADNPGASATSLPALKLPYYSILLPVTTIETFDDGGIFSPFRGMVMDRLKQAWSYRRIGQRGYTRVLVDQESERYIPTKIINILGSSETPPGRQFKKEFSRLARKESYKATQKAGDVSAPTWFLRPLVEVDFQSEQGATPPQFQTAQPRYETGPVQFAGTATFTPVSASPFYQREEQLSADTLTSVAECQAYARLIGTLAHQSYRGRSTNLPIPSEWLADPKPFQVVAIHDGLFVTCNDQITLSNDGIELSWQLYRIGYLSTPVPETGSWTPAAPTVPYTVATPTSVTGATPGIVWSSPAGDWYRGPATIKTGTTPGIDWTVDSTGLRTSSTGDTPVIEWTAPAGEYTTGGGGGY